ncbi:MAG: hypothetical protein FWE25_04270 [Lachnospiraceae bacterium]|nr:hypothetical protein [Lachnospiraceae bacterium]
MRERLGSKWRGIALVLCAIIFLAGCFGRRGVEYVGEHPELYSVALASILGRRGRGLEARGTGQPSVSLTEQDDYGRMFFFYGEGDGIAGRVIVQKVEGDYAYFYQHYNFILTSRDYDLRFSPEDIEVLKKTNSWNQPMSDDSAFVRVRISRHRDSGPISNSRLIEVHHQAFSSSTASNRQITGNTFFLRTDNYGRAVYYWDAVRGENSVAMLFQPDHSIDLEMGLFEITDRVRYQTELREFMEANGWDTPFEE